MGLLNGKRFIFNSKLKNEFLKDLQIKGIARRIGITPSYMSLILCGKRNITDCGIDTIMQAIGYSKNEIRTKKTYFFKRIK